MQIMKIFFYSNLKRNDKLMSTCSDCFFFFLSLPFHCSSISLSFCRSDPPPLLPFIYVFFVCFSFRIANMANANSYFFTFFILFHTISVNNGPLMAFYELNRRKRWKSFLDPRWTILYGIVDACVCVCASTVIKDKAKLLHFVAIGVHVRFEFLRDTKRWSTAGNRRWKKTSSIQQR